MEGRENEIWRGWGGGENIDELRFYLSLFRAPIAYGGVESPLIKFNINDWIEF